MPIVKANNYMAGIIGVIFVYNLLFFAWNALANCCLDPEDIADKLPIALAVFIGSTVATCMILGTAWFICVQFLWDDYTSECFEGWN